MSRFQSLALLAALLLGGGPTAGHAVAACWQESDLVDPCWETTFESISIYWSPPGGAADRPCRVQYRRSFLEPWRDGQELWFDPRDGADPFAPPAASRLQYRGSIVGLEPGAAYDVLLTLDPGGVEESATFTCRTWDEEFPVSDTTFLARHSRQPYLISAGGSPEGYRLYTRDPANAYAAIDLYDYAAQRNPGAACVRVEASYVILRELVLHGGRHGVELADGVHDVVIEYCDISGWGQEDTVHTYAYGLDHGAISTDLVTWDTNFDNRRFIIQRNRIHHPRWDSTYWEEFPEGGHDEDHPRGPLAIYLRNTGGNHVIRYNEIFSDSTRMFFDILTGGSNYSDYGFPGADSDIYQNRLADCWDDAIEAEGGGVNVRIWENYIDRSQTMIALATTSIGPLYVFRNVAAGSRKQPGTLPAEESNAGVFVKLGNGCNNFDSYPDNCTDFYGNGRIYLYHNTTLQPEIVCNGLPQAVLGRGVAHDVVNQNSNRGPVFNLVSRNNIFQVREPARQWAFHSRADDDTTTAPPGQENHYDYDLCSGDITELEALGEHLLWGLDDCDYQPDYDPANDPEAGIIWLAEGAAGQDDGCLLPGFNDDFSGAAPDRGAGERAGAALEYGRYAELSGSGHFPPLLPRIDLARHQR